MNNQIPRGQTSLVLLESLLNGGDKYGTEFLAYIQAKYPNIEIKQPTLYTTLARMEKQELISSYWRDGDFGGKRHYYSITDYGKKVFENEKKELLKCLITEIGQKKYDEIGGFQKSDGEIVTNQNSSQNFDIKNTQDNGIFLENDDAYYIPKDTNENGDQKYDEIEQIEKNDNKLDEGIFITDTISESQIPKVKKIASDINFDLPNESELTSKIVKSSQAETASEKIEALYHKQKFAFSNSGKKDDFQMSDNMPKLTLSSLGERYKNMNINFYASQNENKKIATGSSEKCTKIPSTQLFAKYFTIFLLILLESAGIWCWCYFGKNIIPSYQFAYIILPVVFAIISFAILFSKKKFFKFEKQKVGFWLYVLIFIFGVVLLYSLNILLGITFSTILDFETTFVYPAILLTNVLIAGIFDKRFAKKYQ